MKSQLCGVICSMVHMNKQCLVYTGVPLSIGDWRILPLLHIILGLNFNGVWLFFYSDESDMDMLYYCKKKLFPELRNFSA